MWATKHTVCDAVCKVHQTIERHLRGEIGEVGDHFQDLLKHVLPLLTAHGLHDGEQDLLQLGEQVGQPAHAVQHCAQSPQAPEGCQGTDVLIILCFIRALQQTCMGLSGVRRAEGTGAMAC